MPRIWGARSLAPIYPREAALSEPIGEAWLTGRDSEIASGPFCGALKDAWPRMPVEWRGTDFSDLSYTADFPILVKFLFPKDQLSIQVHPSDVDADSLESPGTCGKTEMWHAVSAETGATLLLGLVPDVDKSKFEAAITKGGLEDFIERVPVFARDTFFVVPGTPHTIGPGMILCEVQQNSDLTYRLYDFVRRDAKGNLRQLHVEKAMAVIDFERRKGGKIPAVPLSSENGAAKFLLAACPYFASERWDVTGTIQEESNLERFELLVVLSGRGNLHWDGGSSPYVHGECWFIPAQLGKYSISSAGITSILRTYVPKLPRLRRHMREAGVSESQLQKVFFEKHELCPPKVSSPTR